MATNSISNFYHLEQVWNLGIIAKCYCSQVSKIITKLKIFDSISNPKEVTVLIKFWKLQTIFTTFNPKENILDGFELAAPQECPNIHDILLVPIFLLVFLPSFCFPLLPTLWRRLFWRLSRLLQVPYIHKSD